jgi:peptidoglycan/LPS O-acetylase OafA/YrhL
VKVYTTRRDIQVLRGVSVIAVVLFHFYPQIFSKGYLGVDVFFVISGYLLIPKMLEIGSTPDDNLSSFFLKRFARLTPALCVTIVLFCTWMFLFGPLEDQRFAFAQAITAVLNLSNIEAFRLSQGDYFNPNPNGLLHTWSLSVEQQIYFILPFLLVMFSNMRRKISLIYLFLAVLAVHFLFMRFTLFNFAPVDILNNRGFYYFSPLFRGFEFLLGAVIRLQSGRREMHFLNQKYLWPLILIVLTVKIPDEISLVCILLISVLILAKPEKPIKGSNIFAKIGDRSYSIYLIHFPIIYIFNYYFASLNFPQFLVTVSLILVLSELSRKYLEIKYRGNFLKKSKAFQGKTVIMISAMTLIFLIALRIGSVNYYWMGNPPILGGSINCEAGDYGNCGIPSSSKKNFLLVGDSHAAAIADSFRSVFSGPTSNAVVMYGRGCPLHLKLSDSEDVSAPCNQYMKNVFEMLQNYEFDVIIAQRSSLVSTEPDEYRRDLLSSINRISNMAGQVYIISPNYELREGHSQGISIDLIRAEICIDISDLNQTPRNDFKYLMNGVISENVDFIDSAKIFSGNKCHYIKKNSKYLYWDSNHLSTDGAEFYKAAFTKILSEIS